MKKSKTLVIIKPDALKNNIIGKIITTIENNKFKIINIKMLKLNHNDASNFYIEHKNKIFYDELINFMLSGYIIAIIVEGCNAIEKIRNIIGHTDFRKAKKGSIREMFSKSLTENTVHASDDINSFNREKKIIFG